MSQTSLVTVEEFRINCDDVMTVFSTYLQHVFMNLIESYEDIHYLTQIRLSCLLHKSWLIE